MSVELNTQGSIVMKSAGAGTGSMTISAPTLAASRAISIYDPLASCNLALGIRPYASIPSGAVYTVTAAQSGTVFTVDKGAARDHVMPAPTIAGLHYRFISGAVAANVVRLDCGAGLLDGVITNVSGAPPAAAVLAAAGNRYVSFTAASVIGDWIELVSDGTHWKVSGMSSVVGVGFA